MKMSEIELKEFKHALLLSREKGVGAVKFRRLIEQYTSPTIALEAWNKEKIALNITASRSLKKSSTKSMIESSIRQLSVGAAYGYWFSQTGYPKQLTDLTESPPVLFVSSPVRPVKIAAIVGSRKILPEAAIATRDLTIRLLKEGYSIISGGAVGVDTVAHSVALEFGGYTIAVLATGIDVVYPPQNAELFDKIRQNGTLMTEMMFNALPQRSFFPARNRIIAAMAEKVFVVQAGEKSGAMITAAWAAKLNKKIITTKLLTNDENSWAGNKILIEAGASIFDFNSSSFFTEPTSEFFWPEADSLIL